MIWIEINVHIFPMETGICSMEFRISQISEPPAIRYRNYAKVSPDTVDRLGGRRDDPHVSET